MKQYISHRMIGRAFTATLHGIEAVPVTVEVDLRQAADKTLFEIVGLPDQGVAESRQRIRSAVRHSELNFPKGSHVIVNLAPGDIRKEGPSLDLPIAAAILSCDQQVPISELDGTLILGELGLDGLVRPIDGAVSVALMAIDHGFRRIILPKENAEEAAITPDIEVFGVSSLEELAHLLNGGSTVAPVRLSLSPEHILPQYGVDFAEVKGQRQAIRAIEIAAAGGHNLLMIGPPGSGKTMLARRIPTILPPLTTQEAIEVTRIYSSSGAKAGKPGLIWERPFRAPHHSASHPAIVGGGKIPRAGEVSHAHLGVLFMDEMPEFDRAVLEALRQPLEDGLVTISRAHSSLTFPAECMLIGAMNPCPCGFKGYPEQRCVSSPTQCSRYASRISGPLLDRIDLHIEVPKLKPEELLDQPAGEPSATLRQRVEKARLRQYARLGGSRVNSKMTPRELQEMIQLDDECRQFMRRIMDRMNVSGRVFDRILKVAQTIADLAEVDSINQGHLAEATQYRERIAD